MMAELNWVLQENRNHIKMLSDDYPRYFHKMLSNFGFQLNRHPGVKRVLDWDQIEQKSCFFFDFEHCEKNIAERLSKALTHQECSFIVELGYDNPIVEVSKECFVEKWHDFAAANGWTGYVAISSDGKVVIEFTDDHEYLLLSNIEI